MSRPTVITKEVIEGMKQHMIKGISLKDACTLLNIGTSTWRDYEEKNPEVREQRKAWQGMLVAKARMNVAERVFAGDVDMSTYVLDSEMKREEKRASNALTRARARQTRAEAKLAEIQLEQLEEAKQNGGQNIIVDDIARAKELERENDDSTK